MGINFAGGVYLPKNKDNSLWDDITEIRPAEIYSVPVNYTNGYPMKITVKIGALIKEGELIAKPTTSKGSFIYSPISGKVIGIVDKFTPSGNKCLHVVIKNDFKLLEYQFSKMVDTSPKELLKRLAVSGIVDATLGGAPSYLRYTLSAIEKKFTLYVLACNTEPYLSANEALIINRTAQVISGAKYFAKLLGSNKIMFIVTTRNRKVKKVIDAYMKKNEPQLKYGFKTISSNYPYDNLKLLMQRLKPKHSAFIETNDSNVFIEDAITCHSFYNAVECNKPTNYRVVTVSGNNVIRKGNYIIKNGTSFEHILEVVGFKDNNKPFKILNGGVMMGICEYTTEVCSNLETQSVTFLDEKEFSVENEKPCINCGKCVSVCPMNLLPNKLDEFCVERQNYNAKNYGINSCIECGCCSYICPSKRYLTQRISAVKRQIEGGKV